MQSYKQFRARRAGAKAIMGIAVALVLLSVGGIASMRFARQSHLTKKASKSRQDTHSPRSIEKNFAKLPLAFEPNRGQSAASVKYLAHGDHYSVFLTGTGATIALKKSAADAMPKSVRGGAGPAKVAALESRIKAQSEQSAVIRLSFEGARDAKGVQASNLLPGTTSYLIGNDPKRWHRAVPNYARVRYEGVYPGIDVIYYGKQRELEFDLAVAAGADPDRVRLAFEGADRAELSAHGDLILHTRTGDVSLHEPAAFQRGADGKRRSVGAHYRKASRNIVSIELAPYDRSRPLIIDPTISYATYIGGSVSGSVAFLEAITADSSGHAIVAGFCENGGYPTTTNLPNDQNSSFANSVVATEFSADGSSLIYSAVFGGTHNSAGGITDDEAHGVAVDQQGNIYVTGTTDSINFPISNTAIHGGTTLNQGNNSNVNFDVFVTSSIRLPQALPVNWHTQPFWEGASLITPLLSPSMLQGMPTS